MPEERYRALIERARRAVDDAERTTKRSAELAAFLRALSKRERGAVVRCAWCGRISSEGYWIDPAEILGGLPPRVHEISSHSICPGCYDRVSAAAAEERAKR